MERRHSIPPPPLRPGARLVGCAARRRVLLVTEGTYPYAVGGVSSWCQLLLAKLTEIDWQVLPIVDAERKPRAFELPPNAEEIARIELWTEALPPGRRLRGAGALGPDLPAVLVRGLIGWDGDTDAVVRALVACRRDPAGVRSVFRSRAGREAFLDG